jgi:hypothetical protein
MSCRTFSQCDSKLSSQFHLKLSSQFHLKLSSQFHSHFLQNVIPNRFSGEESAVPDPSTNGKDETSAMPPTWISGQTRRRSEQHEREGHDFSRADKIDAKANAERVSAKPGEEKCPCPLTSLLLAPV